MATLLLQTAGSALGEMVGGPIGGVIGKFAGTMAGAYIDNALMNGARATQGPRLTSLAGLASTEGSVIPRVYGRVRIGGQIIWATRFEEVAATTRSGAAGGKGGASGPQTTTFTYYANIAVGLCEGQIAQVRRIWADGNEIDQTLFTIRVHRGSQTQDPDPLVVAKEGADHAPASRGLAYVVFERMPLANFGNRVPQLAFEVVRPVDGLATMIRAVDVIPSATEFGYAIGALSASTLPGVTSPENRHQLVAASDWTASIDALQALCPNLGSVALTVAWFGDDLRAGHCTIAPRVEAAQKSVIGADWSVAGLSRAGARVVSQIDSGPALGGTPSDDTVIGAIRDLKARGLSVVFYPFVMMDIAPDNALPDPWTGAGSQPAYPWRGRITCDPAPGRDGSPDGTSGAGDQLAAFFGSPTPGAGEWSYRRFILHCAALCVSAGGVDGFLLGSELVALSRVRQASGVYPATTALVQLAGDVKAQLGAGTKISYGADWTEYGAHVRDGGAEVRFPLDPLWACEHVDFVGIDAYFPLSDWRDGLQHADAAIARSVNDLVYLRSRVAGGEDYDWYYASDAARQAQLRTPITDGACGKPWVFRAKDLRGWWSSAHVERMGGVELATATSWTPAGKPIWLMETGCPAIDRGANAPNVFVDPKSSESAQPPFSRGFRDDLMQLRTLEAVLGHFDPGIGGNDANPVSAVYGGRMVDLARIHVWAWDARPFPAFPALNGLWSDAPNWETGHWINGRLEGVTLDGLVAALVNETRTDAPAIARPGIDGFLDGYALDRVISTRDAIEPLCAMYGFDAVISGGDIRFASRAEAAALDLGIDDLVPDRNGRLFDLTRAQESEIPNELSLIFADGARDYRSTSVLSRRVEGWSNRESQAEVAVVTEIADARRRANIWLQDHWLARETVEFRMRPGLVGPEAGDGVTLEINGHRRRFRIEKITDALQRTMTARACDPTIYDAPPPFVPRGPATAPVLPGPPHAIVLDLAVAREDPAVLQHVAVFADPWPGALALWRSTGASFTQVATLTSCAIIGETMDDLPPGRPSHLDLGTRLRVQVRGGALVSVDVTQMLAGANLAALRGGDGAWEIFGFAEAELIGDGLYRLSKLLRGLGGEEQLAQRLLPAGADFVLLDTAVTPLVTGIAALGLPVDWRVGPAGRDYADGAVTAFQSTPGPKALMPYAPVRPCASRGSGGVTFSFVRRGRRDSDGWEPIDIPLGEDSEAYDLEILRDGAVVRTLPATSTQIFYASEQELADFGAPQGGFDIRAFQKSASVGRGFPLSAHVAV